MKQTRGFARKINKVGRTETFGPVMAGNWVEETVNGQKVSSFVPDNPLNQHETVYHFSQVENASDLVRGG